MEENNQTPVQDYSVMLRDRVKEYAPDVDFDSEGGEGRYAETLYGMVDKLSNENKDYKDRMEKDSKVIEDMNRLMDSDPRFADFVVAWLKCGSATKALIDTFGPSIREMFDSEEKQQEFIEANEEYLARKAEDDAFEKEREKNWNNSLKLFDKFAKEKNLEEEQLLKIYEKLLRIGMNASDGIYDQEDIQMAYDALHFAQAVEEAREEGKVEGKAEKIAEQRIERNRLNNLPPTLSGQGGAFVGTPKKDFRRESIRKMFGMD